MINIRQATKKDLQILSEVYTVAYNSLGIGENWTVGSAHKLIKYLYEDQPDLFFVAQDGGAIVGGIVATVRPWWDGNHLIEGEIFVHPKHQKKGIGVKLIEKLFTVAKERYSVVSWDTYTHKVYKDPLVWYKSLGFEEIKHWTMITGDIDKVLKIIKEHKEL